MTTFPDSSRLPVEAAAAHLGLSASTLNKLRVFGGGPVFLKLGRRVVYDVTDLDAWLATKRRQSTSDGGEQTGG
jgi:predicted DNA-binding transcriptional regulator AlpA